MLRIEDWIKSFFWVPLIGAFFANVLFKNFFLIAIIFFCVTAYGYAVNNYFDAEIDRKHSGKIKSNKNPFASGFITKNETLIILGILLSISIILSFKMNFTGFIFTLLSISVSTLYSVKYIKLKEKPILDLISHGFMFGFFPFLAGITLTGANLNFLAILVGILFFIITANELVIHQIIDYEEDLKNTKTTAIKIGLKISYICLFFLFALFALFLILIIKYFTLELWSYYLSLFFLFWLPFNYAIKIKNINISQLFNRIIKI